MLTQQPNESLTTTLGMNLFATMKVWITGHNHSNLFTQNEIQPTESCFTAFREREYSNMEEHSFQVRASNTNTAVLCAHDQDPSDKTLTQDQKECAHRGYIAFGTDAWDGLVQLMDDGAIGPYAKIICVYTSVSVSGAKWMCHDGCGHCAYPGKAFIFVE